MHPPNSVPALKPVVISAPFGNYVQPDNATPTLGTFTAKARPGRAWRVLKTVRYYPRLKAWVNRIGLRNPGMPWLVERVKAGKKNVAGGLISIHGFADEEWYALLDAAADLGPLGIELNMSCPNVGQIDWPTDLFERAVASGIPIVVKTPPVNYDNMLRQSVDAGVRCFHCCNTLPTPSGGISGAPLKPVSLATIHDLRTQPLGDQLTIIGGGGIYRPQDIDDYRAAGADHFALGTKVMHPKYLFSDAGLRPLIDHAGACM